MKKINRGHKVAQYPARRLDEPERPLIKLHDPFAAISHSRLCSNIAEMLAPPAYGRIVTVLAVSGLPGSARVHR
jgi:hypothetical protein